MTEVKTIKLEQKFNGTEDLYRYLLKNVDVMEQTIGIEIQKPLKQRPFCISGRELITERNILFYASEKDFLESLGELIVLAGGFDADIIVFFLSPKTSKTYIDAINWLQSICNADTEFIICKI